MELTIPAATKNPNGNCSPSCPTGNVSNGNASYFGGGPFIVDTEDGILANWTGASTAVVAFDNSASGAVCKGLALLTPQNAGSTAIRGPTLEHTSLVRPPLEMAGRANTGKHC
jgi:hypothetical protein